MCHRPSLTYFELEAVQFEPVSGPAALLLCILIGWYRKNQQSLTHCEVGVVKLEPVNGPGTATWCPRAVLGVLG